MARLRQIGIGRESAGAGVGGGPELALAPVSLREVREVRGVGVISTRFSRYRLVSSKRPASNSKPLNMNSARSWRGLRASTLR